MLGFILFCYYQLYRSYLYSQFSSFLNKLLLRRVGIHGAEESLLLSVTTENGNDRQLSVLD